MKIAILHDFLLFISGAERILCSLLKIYPQADVFTLAANNKIIEELSLNKFKIIPLIKKPFFISNKLSLLQLTSPFLWKKVNTCKYDLIFSNQSVGLSNIIDVKGANHVQYILTYPKNIFLPDYKFRIQKIIPYQLWYADLYNKAIKSTPFILTDSLHMQISLEILFNVKAKIIYPPVNTQIKPKRDKKNKNYYLYIGRLDISKSIDIAIHACNKLKLPLKIIGQGFYYRKLKNLAGPTIEFTGYVPDHKLEQYYNNAKGFIFCSYNEDFGIAPVEALSHGVPVICYYGGALKEIVTNNVTGMFFYEHNVSSLCKTLIKFENKKFSNNTLHHESLKYSESCFLKKIKNYIDNII